MFNKPAQLFLTAVHVCRNNGSSISHLLTAGCDNPRARGLPGSSRGRCACRRSLRRKALQFVGLASVPNAEKKDHVVLVPIVIPRVSQTVTKIHTQCTPPLIFSLF
jgi:hypothetical protein